MNQSVIVTADDLGNVIGQSKNNPEYGYVRVEQIAPTISEDGWFRFSRRSALIKGRMEELQAFDFKAGMELPGKIVVREQLTPFNPDNPEKHMKIAGSSEVPCTLDDQPIYRDSFYTNNPDAQDVLIAHNNKEQIREAMAQQKLLLQVDLG